MSVRQGNNIIAAGTNYDELVHKTGEENISGRKNFRAPTVPLQVYGTDNVNESPSEQIAITIGVTDANGNWEGGWEHYHNADGSIVKQIAVKQQHGEDYNTIGLGIRADGSKYTWANTPPPSSNDAQIATTAWVNNKLSADIFGALYPVGSLYFGTQGTCPLATLIPGSQWQQIQGRYLLASGTLAGTNETYSATNTVNSGLPNISGSFGNSGTYRNPGVFENATGAFASLGNANGRDSDGGSGSRSYGISFEASRSNSIYGSSDAVRAPAYVVNVWRRTA